MAEADTTVAAMIELLNRLADPDQNVLLTGFMGTGKSTVGRLLADRLGFGFIDTDEYIEKRHGCVQELFRSKGEPNFRELEREISAELSTLRRQVVATGGRLLLDPSNEATLGSTGRVACLWSPADEILRRVHESDPLAKRPLLDVPNPGERVDELLAERSPLYRRFPLINTLGLTPSEVAADIASLVATRPILCGGDQTILVGIGIAAAATSISVADGVVIDVARLQPSLPLPVSDLIAMQETLTKRLNH